MLPVPVPIPPPRNRVDYYQGKLRWRGPEGAGLVRLTDDGGVQVASWDGRGEPPEWAR